MFENKWSVWVQCKYIFWTLFKGLSVTHLTNFLGPVLFVVQYTSLKCTFDQINWIQLFFWSLFCNAPVHKVWWLNAGVISLQLCAPTWSKTNISVWYITHEMIYASLSLLMCKDVNTFLSYNVTNQINTVGPVWHHSSAKMMKIGSAENMNSHGELVWLSSLTIKYSCSIQPFLRYSLIQAKQKLYHHLRSDLSCLLQIIFLLPF